MTTQDLNRTESLAQQTYEFVNPRFPDHAAPVLAMLNRLGIDRAAFMELEPMINGAINEAEHNGFTVGFLMSSAIANLPVFSTDPMDAVLMPDRYVAA